MLRFLTVSTYRDFRYTCFGFPLHYVLDFRCRCTGKLFRCSRFRCIALCTGTIYSTRFRCMALCSGNVQVQFVDGRLVLIALLQSGDKPGLLQLLQSRANAPVSHHALVGKHLLRRPALVSLRVGVIRQDHQEKLLPDAFMPGCIFGPGRRFPTHQ